MRQAKTALAGEAGAIGAARGWLEQMADLIATVEGVVNRFLRHPKSSRAALAFVAGVPLRPKARGTRG